MTVDGSGDTIELDGNNVLDAYIKSDICGWIGGEEPVP